MIAIPGNVRVWLATGHTDMRRGFPSLARLVEEGLKRDPHIGDLYVFRGRRGDLGDMGRATVDEAGDS
jgi:transposase